MHHKDIALVREQLDIATREVESARVSIAKRAVEHDEAVALPLRSDAVEIERVSLNRVVAQASPIRYEGDVTIVPVYEEQLVVTKQLVLKEELRITRRSSVRAGEPQRFTLRREEIEITRTPADKPTETR